MSQEKSLKETVQSTAQDAVLYGGSALFVTPFTTPLQNIKVALQTSGGSHTTAIKDLYKEGKSKRFYHGFLPYTARNAGVSALGGVALEQAEKQTKNLGYGKGATAALNAIIAGAAETAGTAYMEGVELTKTKNISYPPVKNSSKSVSSIIHTSRNTAKISPLLFGRNSIYWLGTAATTEYADKHNLTINQRASLGTATGFVSGIASLPLDVVATKAFAEKSIKNSVKEIIKDGPKAAFRGASVRGLQMGVFTAATSAAIELNKTLKESSYIRN